MIRKLAVLPVALLVALPAAAQEVVIEDAAVHDGGGHDAFFSLYNTDFVVTLAFLLFLAVLAYFKVPSQVGGMLDKRSDQIRKDLDEARSLRDEAQALLASYERKQKDVQAQADRIVENARTEASRAAEQSKEDIRASVERRLAGATEQIESAQAAAVQEVQNRAVTVAVAAAREVLIQQMTPERRDRMIESSIQTVRDRMH
ncbi:ATP F0F1 synthase subunit B [Pseudoroseicyclus aestuarii]|nr:ATP F0F1 synthase subunit B [Pseudoroseicyclus aestuarii]